MNEVPRTSRWDEVDEHDPEIPKNLTVSFHPPGGLEAAREWLRRSWRPLAAATTAVTLIVGIILGSWAIWFRTTSIDLTIESVRWVRKIEVEQFRTLDRSDWRGEQPSDARIYDTRSEVHHYDHIYTGQTCYGSGNSRHCTSNYINVPSYRDKYYYRVDRWVQDSFLVADGTDQSPSWPFVPLEIRRPVPDVVGLYRQGDEESEDYKLYVANGKQTWGRTVPLGLFLSQIPGSHITGQINSVDQIRSVKWNVPSQT